MRINVVLVGFQAHQAVTHRDRVVEILRRVSDNNRNLQILEQACVTILRANPSGVNEVVQKEKPYIVVRCQDTRMLFLVARNISEKLQLEVEMEELHGFLPALTLEPTPS